MFPTCNNLMRLTIRGEDTINFLCKENNQHSVGIRGLEFQGN